jgi:hypothetical protein
MREQDPEWSPVLGAMRIEDDRLSKWMEGKDDFLVA